MGYEVIHTDDVPVTDLSQIDEVPPDLDVRSVDEALGVENTRVKLWYLDPGEEVQYHAHLEQEELYYALQGTFSLKLGPAGNSEIVEAKPGTFWIASPKTGHGHRNIGDTVGVVLAVGVPAVDDPGQDPHSLTEEE